MGEFRMPSLGADMETGRLVEWLVRPGERVRRGDIVAVIETQKGLFEVEIFEDGIMGEPLVQAGEEVPVGTVLAIIAEEGAPVAAAAAAEPPAIPPEPEASSASPCSEANVPTAVPAVGGQRFAASPSARRLALELGVDIASVHGTGPHGVIQRGDVELAAALLAKGQEKVAAVLTAGEHGSGLASGEAMRRAIAAAMTRSNQEIPHYYLEMEIDLSRPLVWLEAENGRRPLRQRILPVVLLLKAVARGLREVPELNGFWRGDRLEMSEPVHVGFAVALRQGGLVTPAIHHVDRLGLDELMQALADLIERTRAGRLRSSEMTDATITVTSLGDRGVRSVFGVIYPPQVALVGFGRITERPWAEDGVLSVRRCLTATLAADHRATDGLRGALFLEVLNRHLQQPEGL